MKRKKIRVAILFGGKSAEHEISLQSAKNVADAIDKKKYEVVFIGIDKAGKWFLVDSLETPFYFRRTGRVALVPGGGGTLAFTDVGAKAGTINPVRDREGPQRVSVSNGVDVVFPILHGPFGEDGTVQGLLKLAGVPFVGAGVLGSAIGMDKDVMKRLLRDARIPTADFMVFRDGEKISFPRIVKKLGLPFFVKPANLGSSVGVHKVKNRKQFAEAIRDAFSYDRKILVEECIKGRELECSVLGNEKPIVSLPGEVLPQREFYSYEAKYIDKNGARFEIPANVSKKIAQQVQKLAVEAFNALCCEGMARVDFFLGEDGKIFLNEINTIPGFTSISMYPRLWAASGLSYGHLVDKLIQLAIERFKKEQRIKTSY